ncbi:polysaccharide deacetylase family protein [Kitasatospora sp. NPDC058032]|uniref:polysaccharide deacetylase family protein n=1 Tax=Kitasatospora sp. NPDC058032 TaxID=3346307 RepID=UPI0036D94AE0
MTDHRARPDRRRFLTAATAAGTLAVLGGGLGPGAPAAVAARRSLLGHEVRRLPTEEHVLAVTFNAAWNDDGLPEVLTALERRGVGAAFFLTGRFAEQYPAAARTLADAGHGLANHSYDHSPLAGLTADGLREQVRRTDRAIRAAVGTGPLPFYRFPYGETTPEAIEVVNALGRADIEFTQDTNGYLGTVGGMTVPKAVERAVAALVPGAILQLHLGSSPSNGPGLDPAALPLILDAAEARGYRVTTLDAFLDPATGLPG